MKKDIIVSKNPNFPTLSPREVYRTIKNMKTRTYNLGMFGIVRTPKDIKRIAKEIEKRALELMNNKMKLVINLMGKL